MSANPNPSDRVRNPHIYRPLPHNADAEISVVGAMLQVPAEVLPLLESLPFEAWYLPSHSVITAAALALWRVGKPVTLITVTTALRDDGRLDDVGGPAYLTRLVCEAVASAVIAEHYLGIIREQYALRCAIATSHRCFDIAGSPGASSAEIADALEVAASNVRDAATDPGKAGQWDIEAQVGNVIDGMEQAYKRRGETMGLATGLAGLDKLTGGLQRSEMIVIAARPSIGKTAIAMNIAEHVAVTKRQPVGIFSLEMSTAQLLQRLICARARVNLQHVRDGFMSESDLPRIQRAAKEISVSPLYIDDRASLPINELKATARQMDKAARLDQEKRGEPVTGLVLIVIDYLQLLRSTSKRAQENRQLEVSEISAGCKALAKELNIPVIVLAQLNRNPEARAGGRPRLSDLRESGSVEQDSDLVAMLHRAEYYAEDDAAKEKVKGEAELCVLKQRNGPVDDVHLTYIKEFTRFEDRAPKREVAPAKIGQALPYEE